MAEILTFEQRQAVEDRGGKLLVSAAAGSGKTKVLVDRLIRYILDPSDPANIDDFLIITYTKAAASELRGKITAKLSELIAQNAPNKHLQQQMQRIYLAKISTVHGFCTDILRQYAYRMDIAADFRVADEGECLELQVRAIEHVLDTAYEMAERNPDFCAFVDSQGLGRDDRQIPEIILKVYNSARCHLNPDGWLEWCADSEEESLDDAAQTPWGRYLIEDLHRYLDLQIDALFCCAEAAEKADGMEKPAALFRGTVAQLKVLRDCDTWDAILKGKDIDYGRLTFPKNCGDLQLAEQMKAIRSACKEGLAKRLRSFTDDSAQILSDHARSASAARGLVTLVRAFSKEYDRLKRARGILDFSDLEHLTLDLFLGKQRGNPTAIASEVGERFREIMVDEYQDSNEIQDAIFSALTQKRQNCFMVGDVKQSIYQFRLADPSIFTQKYNSYLPAANARAGVGRKVVLSHNFRSSAGVISAVNDVFTACMTPSVGGLTYGQDEILREGIPHVPLQEPEVTLYGIDVVNDTYAEESAVVADKICALLDGTHCVRDGDKLRPIIPDDIVILLRSPGSVGGEFLYALKQRGIRCTAGDSTDILQTQEISAVRSILEIILNPLQDIPLVAALTTPVFGFTAEDLASLKSGNRYTGIYNLLCRSDDVKCKSFVQMLDKLRTQAKSLTVTQLLAAIYTETKLLSTYGAMQDGAVKLDNLQAFFQIVSDYESTGPKELSRLMEYLNAAEERGLGTATSQHDKGAVTIMSIHKSKGLEFPVVFLCGLSRDFNQENARAQVLCDKDLGFGLGCVDSKLRVRYPTIAKLAIRAKIMAESISEEMRVLYVAMTRARDRLIMTYAVRNLPSNLRDIAMRLDMSKGELLALEADCLGAWVLQTALQKTEAGAFFAIGGHPNCAAVSNHPWQIEVACAGETDARDVKQPYERSEISETTISKMSTALKSSYKNTGATQVPSKLTATQLKGRVLDSEISDGADKPQKVDFRKPGVETKTSGKVYGSAIHAALQYIRFSECNSIQNIRADVERMAHEQRIDPDQAKHVDCEMLAAFFQTPIGKNLMKAENVLREFKFSILDDAGKYYPNVMDEKILLQGVVDCALIEDDGITVIDFKTDRVTEDTLQTVADRYGLQVRAYADALTRIYQKPVKSAVLYFFGLNKFVDVI